MAGIVRIAESMTVYHTPRAQHARLYKTHVLCDRRALKSSPSSYRRHGSDHAPEAIETRKPVQHILSKDSCVVSLSTERT